MSADDGTTAAGVTRFLRAAARAAARLTTNLDLDRVLEAATGALRDDFGAAAASIWLYEGPTDMLRLESSTRAGATRQRVSRADAPGALGEAARTRAPASLEDLALPLLAGEKLHGVLVCSFDEAIGQGHVDVLETYAAVVAAAIHDVELFAVQQVARAEAELLRAQAESSEKRYRFLAEAIPQLVWTAQPDGAVDYHNQRWSEYTGLTELEGWSWQELIHPDHREEVTRRVAAGIATRSGYEAEYMLRRHDGVYRWHLVRAQPLLGESGQVVKWFGTLTDIDDRKRAEQRQRLLTDATTALLSSLDVDRTLTMLAEALVPAWADGCVVDVVERDELRRVVAVDRDPARAAYAEALRSVSQPQKGAAIYRVLTMDRVAIIDTISDEEIRRNARDEKHIAALRGLAPRSAMILPLRARGRAVGLVWLYKSSSGGRYSPDDVPFFEELAGRVALALDNARLFKDAQEAIVLRDDFLSIASHELKTPLTPLKLQIAAVRKLLGDTQVSAKLQMADRQVDRLTRLINQLLDVSRITQGRLELDREPVDVSALVLQVSEDFAAELRRKGTELRADVRPGIVAPLDRLRIEQVISNLLSNAVKYGQGKPVDVSLEVADGSVRLTVRDHGIGIEARHQERIFDRFERAVSTRHYGGFGLGLWIVRQIVDASGGTIRVESTKDEGSTFIVELPLR